MNTQHIFIKDADTTIPKMYFSNPMAVQLHQCLNTQCKIGDMDSAYPSTLPNDYCVMEVWDICKGDIELVYESKADEATMKCYKSFCPKLK